MIDLKFPPSTKVDKPVPKTAFYKHLEVNAKMKQHFVDDVASIHWLYKLAPSTLHVEDGKQVHEIVFFSAQLKSKECPDDVFLFIDTHMPRHVVFVLEYEGKVKLLLNYKEWLDEKAGTFKIVKSFTSDWLNESELTLPVNGLSMDAIYETMAGSVSGFGTNTAADTRRIIAIEHEIATKQKLAEALQKKIRKEKQFARQVEMNTEARALKREIERLKEELKKCRQE